MEPLPTDLPRPLRGTPVKTQAMGATGPRQDFDVTEADAATPSGPEGLHRRLLGREAGGEAGRGLGGPATGLDLAGREGPALEAATKAGPSARDARHLDEIHPRPDNHPHPRRIGKRRG